MVLVGDGGESLGRCHRLARLDPAEEFESTGVGAVRAGALVGGDDGDVQEFCQLDELGQHGAFGRELVPLEFEEEPARARNVGELFGGRASLSVISREDMLENFTIEAA